MQTSGDQSQWMKSRALQNCVISGKWWRMCGKEREAPFCQIQCGLHCVELILTQCHPKWADVQPWDISTACTGFLSYLLTTEALELPFQMEPDQAKTVLSCLHFPAFVTHLWDGWKHSLAFFFLYPSFPIPTPSFPSFLPMSPSSSSFPLCLPFLLTPSLLPFQTLYISSWLPTCDPSALASWVLGL